MAFLYFRLVVNATPSTDLPRPEIGKRHLTRRSRVQDAAHKYKPLFSNFKAESLSRYCNQPNPAGLKIQALDIVAVLTPPSLWSILRNDPARVSPCRSRAGSRTRWPVRRFMRVADSFFFLPMTFGRCNCEKLKMPQMRIDGNLFRNRCIPQKRSVHK